MRRPGRRSRPRALALRALQELRLAKMAIARLKYRVSSSPDQGEDVERLLALLGQAEKLLDYISVKLEVYTATGVALTEALSKALRAAGALRSLAPILPPQTAALLMEVEESLRGIMAGEGLPPLEGRERPVDLLSGELSEDARRILEEAEAVARTRGWKMPTS